MDGTERNRGTGVGARNLGPPSISFPKGGGAIRGIGEKFAANPVTGSGSFSVPIAASEGRSGFGPELSLSYDSGNGNGPFGFGWNLSLPAITRKTEKGRRKTFVVMTRGLIAGQWQLVTAVTHKRCYTLPHATRRSSGPTTASRTSARTS